MLQVLLLLLLLLLLHEDIVGDTLSATRCVVVGDGAELMDDEEDRVDWEAIGLIA